MCSFFFFSSRRRHTRLVSDWSSDVCSSDLDLLDHLAALRKAVGADMSEITEMIEEIKRLNPKPGLKFGTRSEERRVGKECRSRWWRDHKKKKRQKEKREKVHDTEDHKSNTT